MSNTKGAGKFPAESQRIPSWALRTDINFVCKDQALRTIFSNLFFGTACLRRWNGNSWELAKIKRWNGTNFVNGMLKTWNGTAWITVQTNNL